MSDLKIRFASLGPIEKSIFLARVAHGATIGARESHCASAAHPNRSFDHPDGIILRDANNFVHCVTGYIPHVLQRTEMAGQDDSIMAMIERHYEDRGLASWLSEWLTPP
jgi:hypothetical protein